MKQLFVHLMALSAIMMGGCVSPDKKVASTIITVGHPIDTIAGSCPFLTSDTKGRPVLSWVRQAADSSSIFCYAISTDDGQTFGPPVEIPPSRNVFPHAENLPKILFKPNGEIIAAWGAAHPNPDNQYAGVIFYCQSFDDGKTWTSAKPLVKDTAAKDQRYFDLKLLPNGEAVIAWLDARKTTTQKGSALYLASTHGEHGFGEGHLVEQPCCECCRINLAIDGSQSIHLVYRAIISDSIRDMVHAVSQDGGNHFSPPQRISADNWVVNTCPHSGPSMVVDGGQVQVAWFTGGQQTGIFYTRQPGDASRFADKDAVSAAGRHPQIASLPGGNALIAWEEPVDHGANTYSRIEVEVRGRQGLVLNRRFVTPDTIAAVYPVMKPLQNGNIVLAYTVRSGQKTTVRFQRLNLEELSRYWQASSAAQPTASIKPPSLVAISNSTDPACGMALGKKASDTMWWKGRVLGFCSPGCKLQFQQERGGKTTFVKPS